MKEPSDLSRWDHGGPEPGARFSPALDASTTVNPFLSAELEKILGLVLSQSRHYPDPWAIECRESIGARFFLPIETILPGPGATLLLYQLIREPFFRRLVLPDPVFSEYARSSILQEKPVHRIPPALDLPFKGRKSLRWGIDLSLKGEEIRSGDMLVLVNPVNPTGQEFQPEEVLDLLKRIQCGGGFLLVDESFQDFVNNRSSVLSHAGKNGLIVLRSLTKISGLPGIRAGFLAGPAEIIERIRARMGPWSTGQLEQETIRWVMGKKTAEECGWRGDEKERLMRSLEERGIAWLPGEGPMILADPGWDPINARECRSLLVAKGVRIRLAEGFGPSDGESLVRIGFEAFSRQEEFLFHFDTVRQFC